MVRVAESFNQVLSTVEQIRAANPSWSNEQVLDYFRLKSDLLLSSGFIDDQTGELISLNEQVDKNIQDIEQNAEDILSLEYRAFGEARPQPYQETGVSYSAKDYVIYPTDDPQNYWQAKEDIPADAGAFDSNKWSKASIKDTREQALASFVAAGYGGIGVNAVEAIGTINSTFQTLEGFDIDLIATPLDVTYDKANHGLKLDRAGIWEFAIKVALTFDEVNAGRQIQLRSYNATTATPSTITFNYFVGRNQAGENLILTFAVEVAEGDEGELIQLQVGSAADTFTNSSNIGTTYQVKHISERKEAL